MMYRAGAQVKGRRVRRSGGSPHVSIAVGGESVDVSGVGKRLQVIEPAQRGRLKARFRRVGVRNDGLDLDPHDALLAMDPLRNCDRRRRVSIDAPDRPIASRRE